MSNMSFENIGNDDYPNKFNDEYLTDAAEELGKSLAKQMLSAKYDAYTFQECIGILNLALPVAVDILLKEEKEQEEGK